MDVINVDANVNITSSTHRTKTKPLTLGKGSSSINPATSTDLPNTSTTQIGHDVDPEKRKSPSKRRSIVKPKRKPQAQGYYRRRLEFFDEKQTGTKEEVAKFSEFAANGMDMIPFVMDGQKLPQHLFPLYHKAINSYLEASLKLRQTILTERKLAAEVWGDNSIASFSNGIYTVQKNLIEDLLKPKTEEIKGKPAPSRKAAAPKKRKESLQETPKEVVIKDDPENYDPDNYDINDFIEFSDNMAITRSQTKAIRQVKEPSPLPPPPPPPVPVASSLSSKGKRKNVNPGGKEGVQVVKKARFSKDSSSNTPTPPPVSVPPPPPVKRIPPKPVKETPMPHFKMIEENKISRNAQEIIKDTKVLQCYCKPEFGCDERCVNRALHMECGSRCKIGDQCQNKRFQKLQYAAFEPFFAGVKGWGIRAVKPIHSGDFIVEYVGEVVDSWEMAKRQKKYTKNNHKHHYMMSLRNGAVIDATTCGNFSRFVNHSCDPNAETQKWVVSREIRIGFFAKKEIAAGEEIVFDYAFERFGKEAQQCYCGSENCTGFIGSKPDEGDNEDEEAGSSSSTSEETDDETTKDAANITKKVTKPKLTQEQKEFRKRMAKARRRLVKARREFRKVVGRKKNFSEEEILEFNRQMYRINDYDQRFLIVNFMLTVPDDQWKRTFIEKNGIEVIWSWLTDYSDNRVPLKTFVRLQNGLIKFLDSLSVEYNDHLKLIIAVIKDIMNQQLPDDIILQETLNELIDDVVSDEPEIPDKDLARMLDRDKVSMIKVYGETVEICKRLYGVWSTLPSQLTDGCVDISGDEMDEFKIAEITSNEPSVLEDELPSYETAMETNFDTPEHVSKPETEIVNEVDIGARKHFRSSSRSEKENSHEKRFRSRSRSRSFSPPKRQRSCSKSPIGFGNYLQIAAKTDYRDRDSDRKYSDRFDHYRNRDRKYRYDDHQRGKHFKDRRTDRYYDDRHYESRRYEDRDRRHDRHRDDRHHHSRHRTHRHYDHSDRRDGHSHSHRRRSNSPQRSKRQYSQSPERTKKSSPHVSRKQSPVREHRSVFAKDIKIEIPDTSPIIKSESPPEILSKNSSPAISIVSSSAPPGVSPSINSNLTSSQSNKNVISIETVFPDAPKPIQQPSNDFSSFYSTPPPGTGPKFRSTMQFQGFANTRATKPPPIRFGGFQRPAFHQRFVQPVRLPIIIPPPPQIPSQFVPIMPAQQWYGYPYCAVPPPPPPTNFPQPIQIPQPVQAPQLIEIELPPEPTVSDPQPSYDMVEKISYPTRDSFEPSAVTSAKEIKREEISPVVSDPIQSQPTPEEEGAEESEKSKLKPYEKNSDWIETYTDDGIIYYYHIETRETSWEEPPPKAPEKPNPVFQQSSVSNRSESILEPNLHDIELKKQFKLKIWQNIHKYLKPRKEIQGIDDGTLTQFARKMTHKCLEAETRSGNKNLEITEKVYLRARSITDQNYAQFLSEVRTIKTEPLH